MINLERIIGTEKTKKIKDNPIYQYAVDTTALISFSTPIAMANEVLIADMEVKDSLKARGLATLVNLAAARHYGKYRDYIFKKCKTTEKSGFWKKVGTDILSFSTFQLPLYTGILAGSATIAALSGFIGRPYGIYLDKLRKFCGLKPAYKIAQESQNSGYYKSNLQ